MCARRRRGGSRSTKIWVRSPRRQGCTHRVRVHGAIVACGDRDHAAEVALGDGVHTVEGLHWEPKFMPMGPHLECTTSGIYTESECTSPGQHVDAEFTPPRMRLDTEFTPTRSHLGSEFRTGSDTPESLKSRSLFAAPRTARNNISLFWATTEAHERAGPSPCMDRTKPAIFVRRPLNSARADSNLRTLAMREEYTTSGLQLESIFTTSGLHGDSGLTTPGLHLESEFTP
mmetsp:Transcript_31092/g.96737  ORF Transcript_31092/g.96737 Transcript_31092/m.96737 type:complete len:230 (-) Transcript_31092:171-860(-)